MTATLEKTVPPHSRLTCETGPLAAAIASLRQLAALLDVLSDEQYRLNPVGVVRGSIGGHVRHCIDHFEALLAGAATGRIDYDRRERGTAIETDRFAAVAALERLEGRLASMDMDRLRQPVQLRAMLSGGAVIDVDSSVGRELVFVLSHTVHHNALVAAMCATLGVPLPERFGYAPATVAYLDQSACVPSQSRH